MAASLWLLLLCGAVVSTSDTSYPAWESTVVRPSGRAVPRRSAGERLAAADIETLKKTSPPLPYPDVTVAVRLSDGTIWAGSSRGLMRRDPAEARWRLFHSRYWLLDDRVTDLIVVSKTSVYVQTPAGVNWIHQRPMTLSKKIDAIVAHTRKRCNRLGLVSEIELTSPGSLERWKQHDSDNDGSWTSAYVAAETFRYATTGDEQARQCALRSLRALMFLEKITGLPGYVARSIAPPSTPVGDLHDSERWRMSRDGKWRWKSDTSSDELVGHYFAYSVFYDLAATPSEKEEIRRVVARITDHIIDHDYYYLDPEGKVTTWGVWAPKELNENPKRIDERGLNSLEILSHLKVAEHIVGNPRYAEAARVLVEKHGYAQNTVKQKITEPADAINHSDDALAFLSYYPLLRYERDPKRRALYMASLERSWEVERPEQSPLFNFIKAAAVQSGLREEATGRPAKALVDPQSYDRDACLEWFREVPTDLTYWTVDNSERGDASALPFPIYERAVMKWNGSPYDLKRGGDGRLCDDGGFILLPYWMGRYHRFID